MSSPVLKRLTDVAVRWKANGIPAGDVMLSLMEPRPGDVELDEAGMPIHLPMMVTASGSGPCGDDDPLADHYVCWCGTRCMWSIALESNFDRARP